MSNYKFTRTEIELITEIDALQAENKRLSALYEIAVGNISWNCDDMNTEDVRKMIERHYEDMQKEAQQ